MVVIGPNCLFLVFWDVSLDKLNPNRHTIEPMEAPVDSRARLTAFYKKQNGKACSLLFGFDLGAQKIVQNRRSSPFLTILQFRIENSDYADPEASEIGCVVM